MKTYGRYPIVPVRGEGCRVWDADGKMYLDFLAGVAVNNLGHCHPKVVKAIQEQAATLIHCSNYYHIPQPDRTGRTVVQPLLRRPGVLLQLGSRGQGMVTREAYCCSCSG